MNTFYISRYITKERPQEVEILTGHKSKKETLVKTRVNPCPRSLKKRKRRQKISVSIGRLNY
jgi:hypothetical protein